MNERDYRECRPPRLAEGLLRRLLPEGVLGLSIIGDLRQEYQGISWSRSSRFPRLWYWRTAIALGGRYALLRFGDSWRAFHGTRLRDLLMKPTILTDFRFGFRMLTKTPSMSLIAIVTIGLGVAVCTHTFSSVYGSILKGLPVPGEDRLMYIDANRLDLGAESLEMSVHDFLDLQESQTSFEDVAAFFQSTVNMAGEEGPPERFAGAYVSANALEHLGVPPILGRTFLPDEDAVDASPVVVLAFHVWKNRFAGDPSILGKFVRVNGEMSEIVGIMPEGFRFPFNEGIWIPHRIDAASLTRGAGQQLDVFGRLRDGVTLEVARAELGTIAADLGVRFPESNEGLGFGIQRYERRYMPNQIRAVMWVMLASSLGVLLIACANVANLLLTRAVSRTKEIAVRTALGASRIRVVRQLLVESFILAVMGGVIGWFLSRWGVALTNQIQGGINKPFWIDVRMDTPTFVFAVGVTVVASLAAGFLPALRASGIKVGEILKDETRGSSGFRLGRTSTVLVVVEIAVSCALLIGAGFLIKSVVNLQNVDLGFDTEGILTGRITLFEADYPDADSRDLFFNQLRERLEAEPRVLSAALGTHLPSLGSFFYYVGVEGEDYPTDRDYPAAYATSVTQDYFRTFGVELLHGRDFNSLEAQLGGAPVTIVNQSFVDRYLPVGDPLGRRIRWGISTSQEPWLTIIGVVPDMHVGGGVGGLGNDRMSPERFYLPKGLNDHSSYAFSVRTQGPPEVLASQIREIVKGLDPNLPVYDVTPMKEAIQQATWAFGLFGVLYSVVGGIALFMAAVGLYGVLAFSVGQRRREMGIRMALGAEHSSIVHLVMMKGMKQLGVGLTIGVALGVSMGGPMRYVLYGVEKGDLTVYASVVMTLLAAGLLASYLPARAAAKADPVEAMRV